MNRFAKLLLVTLALCCGHAKGDILTQSEFTQEFAESLSQARPALKVTIVRDLQLKITTEDGRDTFSFLNNAYDTYQQNPKARAEILQRYVAASLESIGSLRGGVDPTRIIPIIKDRPWLEETRKALLARGMKKIPALVVEDLNPDLVILYAEDSPKSFRYLKPEDLERAQIEQGKLRALACENLRRVLPKIGWHGTNGLYMVTAGGNYEASLLLLDSVWSGGKSNVQGDLVVAIPARDLLLVTGSGDPQGIKRMRQAVKKAYSGGSYKLTSKLFVFHNGKLDPYTDTSAPDSPGNGNQPVRSE
jgi:uncharacterized protein YtpQ (UPF0354 family)